MKNLTLAFVISLLLLPLAGKGQNESNRFNYGLGLNMNVPVFKPVANDTLGVKSGWGASLFWEIRTAKFFSLRIRSGFDQTRYLHDIDNTTTVFNNGHLTSTMLYSPKYMSETQFELGCTGNYSFMGARQVLDGTNPAGVRNERYRPPVKYDLGITMGIAFELKPHLLLRFNYTEYVFSRQFSNRTNGRPDQFLIGLDLRFNKLDEIQTSDDYRKAYEQLDNLAGGTMVFMLSTRLAEIRSIQDSAKKAQFIDDLQIAQRNLVKAIYHRYTYSDFLICYDTAVSNFASEGTYDVFLDSTMNFKTGRIAGYHLYAHAGENFYSEYQRWSTGIYIYDQDFKMLEDPFPFFTKYREVSDIYESPANMEHMVGTLNKSLYDQHTAIGKRLNLVTE